MTKSFKHIFLLLAACCLAQIALAQEPARNDWDGPKIKGARIIPFPSYNGSPYLTENWLPGKIELTNGEIIDSLHIRYSSYKDELFYYNSEASSQINIDKATLNGFEFTDIDGLDRVFRKQFFEGYTKTYRFFEILSPGPISIVAHRKTALNTTTAYHDKSGILKNMEYVAEPQLYFYSKEKGYTNIKPNTASFLSKFDKNSQKPIKRLLRKNRIRIKTEDSLIQAWEIINKEGYKPLF